MVEIKIIDSAHRADINIPNEPFRLFGRMIPSCTDEERRCRTVLGGLDTNVYRGTSQEGKSDILFYWE